VGYRAVTLLMEAVNSSETSLSICQTARRYVAEDLIFFIVVRTSGLALGLKSLMSSTTDCQSKAGLTVAFRRIQ
jgi:hypothetical protein